MIVLTALLVCLIPTTIGALLSAIGIAGMDRLVQRNVLAMSGRAVEAAGDVSTLLLDKTGTITLGNRQAAEFVPVERHHRGRAGGRRPALLAGRRDARGPLHRRPGEGEVRAARAPPGRAGARRVDRLHRPDPDVGRGRRRAQGPQGRGRFGRRLGRGSGAAASPRTPTPSPTDLARPAARRCWWLSRTTRAPGSWASSTSRTSSRTACGSGSTNCAGWASRPS